MAPVGTQFGERTGSTEGSRMGIGVSVFLIAAGAVLYWAVTGDVQGLDLDAVGVVLMVVGVLGLVWSLLVSSTMPWRRETTIRE